MKIPPINLYSYPAALVMALAVGFAPLLESAERSRAARAEFQRLHPCPANGERRGPCPGWWVDHVIPLQCGGPDEAANMQWQTEQEAHEKDKTEGYCRYK
ncbi:MAG: hypothetical protein RIR00_869 [Pseudomonadota bacterium]